MNWPAEYKGGNADYFERAGLMLRRSKNPDELSVTTDAQYHRRPENLVRFEASETFQHPDGRVLRAVGQWREIVEIRESDPRVEAEMRRLLERDEVTLPNFLQATRLGFASCPSADFHPYATATVQNLSNHSLDGWIASIAISPVLHARLAIVRGLFTAQDAPEWYQNDGKTFEAMRRLSGHLYTGNTTLVDPVLAVAYPWMYASCVARIGTGLLVLGFGCPVGYKLSMQDDDLSDLIKADLLTDGPTFKVPATPSIPNSAAIAALEWWVGQLSELLTVVLDPTLFQAGGSYLPALHHGLAHAVERLFTSTLRIVLATGSDEYSRRIHLFEVLDLLAGMRLGNYEETLDVSRLGKMLQSVRASMPPLAASVLLPRCERAIDALIEMQSGFAPSVVVWESVRLPKGPVPLSRGVARYLRSVRNGSHGTRREMTDPDQRRLLAIHDGRIPPEVSDLALLHLLGLLAEPQNLSARLLRSS